MENGIFIFEKMEPVESNKLKTWTGLQFSSHYKTQTQTEIYLDLRFFFRFRKLCCWAFAIDQSREQ